MEARGPDLERGKESEWRLLGYWGAIEVRNGWLGGLSPYLGLLVLEEKGQLVDLGHH